MCDYTVKARSDNGYLNLEEKTHARIVIKSIIE